jgi:hypothetical protein
MYSGYTIIIRNLGSEEEKLVKVLEEPIKWIVDDEQRF